MAARRLIAILVVLMLVSTVAAALAPQRRGSSESTETGSTTTRAPSPPSGELIEKVIPARPKRPLVIKAEPGDQLSLTVRVAKPQPVSIDALGLSSFATPDDPARFDILLRERRTVAVEVGGNGKGSLVGRIDAA
jgi:hypothetical protein